MHSKHFNRLAAIIFFALMLMQPGCKKNDDVKNNTPVLETPITADDAVKVTATVTGTVIDENNKPVAGAAITSGTYSTTTDAMGNFVFKNINISKANGNVTVVKSGYYKGIRSFVTAAGKNNYVKIQLIKQVLMGTVISSTGGVVNTLTGASITFPANAFVTAAGAAFNGTVTVYATWIDPTATNLALIIPGDLRGIDSTNGEYLLKSYGMVGAELRDNSGNVIKIAAGKTATVSFPIPPSLLPTAPQTIPLWHFDETAARWKQQGTATKSGNNYIGQVNKFSFWNVDVPGNFVSFDLRLVNGTNNLPLANTQVKITSLSTNISAYGHTNDSGYVSGYVPKNENLKLEVIAGTICVTNTVIYSQNIGPYTANTSLGNINVTLPASQVINFTGTVKNCNNQPVTNGYISLSLSGGNSTIAYTDASGVVTFSLLHCGGTQTYTYTAVDLATGAYSTAATGTTIGGTVNLGNITACGNNINTSGVYIAGIIGNNAVLWKDGVPTFLTNNPAASNNKYAWAVKTLVYNNSIYALFNDEDSTVANGFVSNIKLWKDGVITNITSGAVQTQAYGLDVYNGDVYVCGEEANGNNTTYKVWKNGIASVLSKDTFDYAEVTGIKVINGDVYVSGTVSYQLGINGLYPSKAVYWKNGAINILNPGSTSGGAYGITVANNDIYMCGYDGLANQTTTSTVYWKNGVKTILPFTGNYTKSLAYGIFVDNTDTYVAGSVFYTNNQSINYYNAAYWKNTTPALLTNTTVSGTDAEVFDIFVKNNIVYTVGEIYTNISGIYNQAPLYFQNGVAVPLTGYTANQGAGAYSIFVK